MDPALIAMLIQKNGTDIEAIVNKVGLATLLSLVPHFMAILETVQQHKQ